MAKNQINGVYKVVTDKIIQALSEGVVAWQKPWGGGGHGFISHANGKAYSNLNCMLIMLDGGEEGEYLTMKQIEAEGGTVKKGAKAKMVVFSKKYTKMEKRTDDEGNEVEVAAYEGYALRYYNVFHVNDCEGITPKFSSVISSTSKLSPIESAEEVVNGYDKREKSLTIVRDKESQDAYFSPSRDLVVVPQLGQYKDVNEYYSTLFHELTHSTGTSSRCGRKLDTKKAAFGSDDYSNEELVAEIGSAMCINRLGLNAEKAFNNSVAYIDCWLKKLKSDPKLIVIASAQAEKAVKYIFGDNE